jgi:hypothetical protein
LTSFFVELAAPNEFEAVQAHLSEGSEARAAALQRGETVKLICIGGGMIIGSPMLEKCSFDTTSGDSENVSSPPVSQQNVGSETEATDSVATTDTTNSVATDSGSDLYKNGRYGFSIPRPQSLIAQRESENGDGIEFNSKDGKARLTAYGMNNGTGETTSQLYQEAIKNVHGTLGYTRLADTWFVVTWQDGETLTYEKMFVGPGSYNAFTFTFPKAQQAEYDDTVKTLAKSFRPGDVSQGQ